MLALALPSISSDMQLSGVAAGALGTFTLLGMGVGGLLSGWLADRVGRVRVVWWSVLMFTVFTTVIAACQTYWQIAAMRFVSGFGIGALYTIGTLLAAEYVPTRVRTTVLGTLQAGWAVGFVAAALLAAYLLPRFGWRPLFGCAVVPGVITLALLWSVPDPPSWVASRRATPAALTAGRVLAALWTDPSVRRPLVLLDGDLDRAAVRVLRREQLAAELFGQGSRRRYADHGLVHRGHVRDDRRRQDRLRLPRRRARAPRRVARGRPAHCAVPAAARRLCARGERAVPVARVRLHLCGAVRRLLDIPCRKLSGRRSRNRCRRVLQRRPHRRSRRRRF